MSLLLQKFTSWILVPVLTFFIEKIFNSIRSWVFLKKSEADSEKSNQAMVDKTNAAVSPEEKKDAAEDAIKKF